MFYITLIKGTGFYNHVSVVADQCASCNTIYYADHEHSVHNEEEKRLYLNSARYFKVGTKTWVDHTFASAVVNGMYNFHASTSAFVEFWNMSFRPAQLRGPPEGGTSTLFEILFTLKGR